MDDELERWRAEWTRTGEVTSDAVRRVRRMRRSATLGLFGGWIAAGVLAVACAWFAVGAEVPAIRAALVLSGTLAIVVLAVHTRHHRLAGRADGESPRAHLEELRRRLEREVALARTWWPFALLVGALGMWVPWRLSTEGRVLLADRPGLDLGIVAGLALVTLAAALAQWHGGRRSRRRLEALEGLLAELDDYGEIEGR